MTTPAVDDFIIADEEPASSQRPAQASSAQSASFWPGAKVDLSSAFTPFTNSQLFQENNTVRESQYTGGDTLDEPVWHTLRRDIVQIGRRLAIVVWPALLAQLASKQQLKLIDFAAQNGVHLPELLVNRRVSVSDDDERDTAISSDDLVKQDNLDWDLWGPLVFLLMYSVALSLAALSKQKTLVFSGSFSFTWFFYIVVGLNIQLLGGNISFLLAISATGYSMFPIVAGGLVSLLLVKWKLIRLAYMTTLCAWSVYAGVMSLKCLGVLPGRVLLAIYPVGLMYAVLSWLVVIT